MPDLLPITLMAKRGNWQQYMARKNNKSFLAIRPRVFARDQNTCRYCGFQSDKNMSVVNHDHHYENNNLNNLMTACSLCSQCFFLESVGSDGRTGGLMVAVPEVTQADLNHFCRALFCSMLRDAPYRGKLQSVYLSMQDRAKDIERVFGPGTHEPNIFGQTLIDSGIPAEQLSHPVMQSLKLLPLRKAFRAESEYWRQTTFAVIPI